MKSSTPSSRRAARGLVLAGALAAALPGPAAAGLPGLDPCSLVASSSTRQWRAPLRLAERPVVGAVQLAVSANGDAMAVWLERPYGDHFTVQALRYAWALPQGSWEAQPSTLGGFDWTPPGPVAPGLLDPQVALDAYGGATAVWTEFVDAQTSRIRAAQFVAGVWGAPAYVDPGPATTGRDYLVAAPRVVRDDKGRNVVTWGQWIEGRQGAEEMVGARFDALLRAWSAPTLLGRRDDLVNSAASALFGHSAGAAIALWPNTAYASIDGNRFDLAGGWGGLVPAGQSLDPGAMAPVASHDATGRGALLWKSSPVPGGYPSLQLKRVNPAAGPNWSPAGSVTLVQSFVQPSSSTAVAADAAGNAVFAWNQALAPDFTRGVAARVLTAAGALVPPAARNPPRLDTGDAPAGAVAAGMDREGNGAVAWLQSDGVAPSIFARRLLHTAATTSCPERWDWGALQRLESHATEALAPLVRAYSGGDMLVLWQELRAAGDPVRSIWVAAYR